NAPFIQDPARLKIKAVETSPTNRWLLERLGKLAAGAMIAWLSRYDFSAEERCEAYKLMPDAERSDQSLEGRCGTLVEQAVETEIRTENFLLSEQERLRPWGGCVAVPGPLLNMWSVEQVANHFVKDNASILCRSVGDASKQKLIRWKCVTEIGKDEILNVL